MYKPLKYYSSILGYKTSSKVARNFPILPATSGVYDFSMFQSGFNLPYFVFYIKLRTASGGPLLQSPYNDFWQKIDLSFMSGKITTDTELLKYFNDNLKFIKAIMDSDGRIVLEADRCTDNPEEEALVDFIVTSAIPQSFDSERSNFSTYSLLSASIFPLASTFGPNTGIPNISVSGFMLAPNKLGDLYCPNIFPTSKDATDGTHGYITCCDGYTPTVRHQRGVWDLKGLYSPLLFIRMLNKNTIITGTDGSTNNNIIVAGILVVKLETKIYTTQELADVINIAMAEISPCSKSIIYTTPCTNTNGTLPFVATPSPDGRLVICSSFYELAINGNCSYIDNIFSFDRMTDDMTCKTKAGYVLENVPAGCANDGLKTGKTAAEITNNINYIDSIKSTLRYKIYEYSPKPTVENVSGYISRGESYAYAPTMTGPLSQSIFAYNNIPTSIPSEYWISSQYIPGSQFAEFWSTFNLTESDIQESFGKKITILKIVSIKVSFRASWEFFPYPAGAYVTYPFYNWGLVLNTSSQCKLKPSAGSDTIYFSDDGVFCDQVGSNFTHAIKPSWNNNLESLQHLRARNKACNTDMTQISTVEIPKIYGDYRVGIVFDWKLASRYNPRGVNSTNFEGAYATPSITFRVAYI